MGALHQGINQSFPRMSRVFRRPKSLVAWTLWLPRGGQEPQEDLSAETQARTNGCCAFSPNLAQDIYKGACPKSLGKNTSCQLKPNTSMGQFAHLGQARALACSDKYLSRKAIPKRPQSLPRDAHPRRGQPKVSQMRELSTACPPAPCPLYSAHQATPRFRCSRSALLRPISPASNNERLQPAKSAIRPCHYVRCLSVPAVAPQSKREPFMSLVRLKITHQWLLSLKSCELSVVQAARVTVVMTMNCNPLWSAAPV